MFLTKHHYAIELAKYGNTVFFLNPPSTNKINKEIDIVESEFCSSLYIISHTIPFSKKIKFKSMWLFHFLMKFHIDKIKKSINKEIDIVWSFDLGNYFPFKYFQKSFKVFCPVDKPRNKVGIKSAKGCNVIISMAYEIFDSYEKFQVPMYFVHHGLSEDFINLEPKKINEDEKIRIGLSGNWLRKDIDTNCLLKIIRDNPNITFEMWGSYKIDHSNIGGASSNEMDDFIDQLQVENNVHLHGAVHPRELAIQFQRMDCFLICYDILKDHSNGINYHKIMEYLSTGKVIISNNISSYKNLPGLIEMTESRDNNNELPSLFKKVLENLPDYNSKEKMKKRIFFAQSNSYSKRIEQLEGILSEFQV